MTGSVGRTRIGTLGSTSAMRRPMSSPNSLAPAVEIPTLLMLLSLAILAIVSAMKLLIVFIPRPLRKAFNSPFCSCRMTLMFKNDEIKPETRLSRPPLTKLSRSLRQGPVSCCPALAQAYQESFSYLCRLRPFQQRLRPEKPSLGP